MLAELLSVWWWLLNSTFVYVSPPRKESGTNESYLNLWLDRGCGCHIKPSRTLLISYDNSPWINKKNFDIIMPVYLNSLCAKVNQLSVSFGANKDATNFHCCVAFWQRIWLALVVPKRETFNATSEDKEPVWNRHQQWDWQKKMSIQNQFEYVRIFATQRPLRSIPVFFFSWDFPDVVDSTRRE